MVGGIAAAREDGGMGGEGGCVTGAAMLGEEERHLEALGGGDIDNVERS